MNDSHNDELIRQKDADISDLLSITAEQRRVLGERYGIVIQEKKDLKKIIEALEESKMVIARQDDLIHRKDLDIYELQKIIADKDSLLSRNIAFAGNPRGRSPIRRMIELMRNTKKEFRRHGFKGVIRRAHALLNGRGETLVKNLNLTVTGSGRYLGPWVIDEGRTSVVVPLLASWESIEVSETMRFIQKKAKRLRGKYEIIVVAAKGDPLRAILEEFGGDDRFKIFAVPADFDDKKMIEKGIKESKGKFISVVSNISSKGLDRSFEQRHLLRNSRELRKRLPLKVAYVVPGLTISGGIAIVLNHVNRLQERGYDVLLLTQGDVPHNIDWFENRVTIVSAVDRREYLLDNIDVMVATHWSTVFHVDLAPARRKIYFVQSDERRFNPEKEAEIRSIESTYRVQMERMTEAAWIQRWLKDEFDADAYYVPNGLETSVFRKVESLVPRATKPRVLLEGPIDVWFKGVEDAYEAVKDLDCEIWIVSSQGKPKPHWRCDRFFEKVALSDMPNIYSSCDIFLKMSRIEGFFGPPLESMACGCAVVVGKVTGYDEYIKDGHNALVVEQRDVIGAREAVKRLIEDVALRNTLVANGQRTADEWTWKKSIDWLEKALQGGPVERVYSEENPASYDYRSEMKTLREGRR